jgi:hypothetical protein
MRKPETYIGTKVINAWPMTRGEYNEYRNWNAPEGEDQTVAGYLVEYVNGGQANHPEHVGYISWSPTDVFENTYRPATAMSFGLAIEAMRQGGRVTRFGWNGKGMFLYYVPANRYPPTTPAGEMLAADSPDGLVAYGGYIAMKTAGGEVVPWLASQTDVLATDWSIVGEG